MTRSIKFIPAFGYALDMRVKMFMKMTCVCAGHRRLSEVQG